MDRDGDPEHRVLRQVFLRPYHSRVRAWDLGRRAHVGEAARATRNRLDASNTCDTHRISYRFINLYLVFYLCSVIISFSVSNIRQNVECTTTIFDCLRNWILEPTKEGFLRDWTWQFLVTRWPSALLDIIELWLNFWVRFRNSARILYLICWLSNFY